MTLQKGDPSWERTNVLTVKKRGIGPKSKRNNCPKVPALAIDELSD